MERDEFYKLVEIEEINKKKDEIQNFKNELNKENITDDVKHSIQIDINKSEEELKHLNRIVEKKGMNVDDLTFSQDMKDRLNILILKELFVEEFINNYFFKNAFDVANIIANNVGNTKSLQDLIKQIKKSSLSGSGEFGEFGDASGEFGYTGEGGGNLSGGEPNLPSRKNLVSNKPTISSIYVNELKKDIPSKTYEQNNIFFYNKDANKDYSLDIENTMKTTTNNQQICKFNINTENGKTEKNTFISTNINNKWFNGDILKYSMTVETFKKFTEKVKTNLQIKNYGFAHLPDYYSIISKYNFVNIKDKNDIQNYKFQKVNRNVEKWNESYVHFLMNTCFANYLPQEMYKWWNRKMFHYIYLKLQEKGVEYAKQKKEDEKKFLDIKNNNKEEQSKKEAKKERGRTYKIFTIVYEKFTKEYLEGSLFDEKQKDDNNYYKTVKYLKEERRKNSEDNALFESLAMYNIKKNITDFKNRLFENTTQAIAYNDLYCETTDTFMENYKTIVEGFISHFTKILPQELNEFKYTKEEIGETNETVRNIKNKLEETAKVNIKEWFSLGENELMKTDIKNTTHYVLLYRLYGFLKEYVVMYFNIVDYLTQYVNSLIKALDPTFENYKDELQYLEKNDIYKYEIIKLNSLRNRIYKLLDSSVEVGENTYSFYSFIFKNVMTTYNLKYVANSSFRGYLYNKFQSKKTTDAKVNVFKESEKHLFYLYIV
jgi:hypothetical protein